MEHNWKNDHKKFFHKGNSFHSERFPFSPKHATSHGHSGNPRPAHHKNGQGGKPLSSPGDFFMTREDFFKSCRMGKDEAVFAIYLNMALSNVCAACRLPVQDDFDPGTLKKKILDLSDGAIIHFAHYLFLFASPDKAGYDKAGSLKNDCAAYVEKLVALRNFFCHPEKAIGNTLRIAHELYVFLGKIRQDAIAQIHGDIQAVTGVDMFRTIVKKEGNAYVSYYELTKAGILFICCMGLYADEAHEFCAQLENLKRNDPHGNALQQFFSMTSMRRGRQILDAADPDLLMFADITAHLNKVPPVSMCNLSLKAEREKMLTLQKNSGQSEEHRTTRYQLQERMVEKFAPFAVAYIEDFNVLPDFAFKRLDRRPNLSRERYCFCKFSDFRAAMQEDEKKRIPLDRYLAVEHDSVQFEWIFPEDKKHHGAIKIHALRGFLPQSMLQQILYLRLSNYQSDEINAKLVRWLEAYHALLEKVLDCAYREERPEPEFFQEEFSILAGSDCTGADETQIQKIAKVIGPRLVEYIFEKRRHAPTLGAAVLAKAEARLQADLELEKKFLKERIPDALMIRQVFRYFNLQLGNTPWQFRQLPLSEQHRNCLDYEYQTVHALLGKYTADPKALWKFFRKRSEKKRKKDFPELTQLSAEEVVEYCNSREKLLENSTRLARMKSLDTLSLAALRECIKNERTLIARLKDGAVPEEEISRLLTQYDIRAPKTFQFDSVVKSILKIDLEQWKHAYDHEHDTAYRDRDITRADDLMVSQVSFRHDLLAELLATPALRTRLQNDPRSPWDEKNQKIDFQKGISQMPSPVALREYYDVSTLTQWLCVNSKKRAPMPVCAAHRNTVDKAYRAIRKVCSQDKLLLSVAFAYRDRMTNAALASYFKKSGASVYDLYDYEFCYPPSAQRKIKIRLNDLNKPALVQILSEKQILDPLLRDFPDGEIPPFESLYIRKKQIDAMDRRIRRFFILPVLKFYANAPETPHFERPQEISQRQWDDHDKYERIAEFLQKEQYAQQLTVQEIVQLIKFRNALLHNHFNLLPNFDLGSRNSLIYNALLKLKFISFIPDFLQKKPVH